MDKKIIVGSAVAGVMAEFFGYVVWKKHKKVNKNRDNQSKRILILVNHEVVIYNFRLELVERLLADGYEVHISTPAGKRVEKLKEMGAVIHEISFDRHGMNPADEIRILIAYKHLIKDVHPLIVLGYTIKPNIYGAMASRMVGVPFVANITGLGTAVENGGIKQKLMVLMYQAAFGTRKGRIQRVFFQNKENRKFFRDSHIALDKHALLPGSGVNTNKFLASLFPPCGNGKTGEPIKFAFVSRIMVEKGIDQYLAAAKEVKAAYPATEFHICGFFELEYDRSYLNKLIKNNTVIYDGNIDDVAHFMSSVHCIVHPTYYSEGMSNVLLEASSCGRAIITTDRAGCREICNDGVNGYLVAEKDITGLIGAIKRFIELDSNKKAAMGVAGRRLIEKQFDRRIVVEKYLEEIHKAERK